MRLLQRYLHKIRGIHETPKVLLLEAERKLGEEGQSEDGEEMEEETIQEYGDKSRVEVEFEVETILRKSDEELFINTQESDLPDYDVTSYRYIASKHEFISHYIEDIPNSQEMLNQLSQMPTIVIKSQNLKDRINHFNKKEKAQIRLLKTLNDTIG